MTEQGGRHVSDIKSMNHRVPLVRNGKRWKEACSVGKGLPLEKKGIDLISENQVEKKVFRMKTERISKKLHIYDSTQGSTR